MTDTDFEAKEKGSVQREGLTHFLDHGFIEMWNEGHCQPHIIASERGEDTGYHKSFDYMILLGY